MKQLSNFGCSISDSFSAGKSNHQANLKSFKLSQSQIILHYYTINYISGSQSQTSCEALASSSGALLNSGDYKVTLSLSYGKSHFQLEFKVETIHNDTLCGISTYLLVCGHILTTSCPTSNHQAQKSQCEKLAFPIPYHILPKLSLVATHQGENQFCDGFSPQYVFFFFLLLEVFLNDQSIDYRLQPGML